MKIVQTFWIDEGINPMTSSFGWCSPKFHLMSWTLSCLQLQKFYGDVELITDSKGRDLLINVLKLPYKNVRVELDRLSFDPNLWVLKKIYSYTLHTEPFLNIDGDVFIFNEFPIDLFHGNLIAQNIENGFWYYKDLVELVNSDFKVIPSIVRNEHNNLMSDGTNTGIVGGLDLDFFLKYFFTVKNFVTYNEEAIQELPPYIMDKFNIFLEQFIFHSLAKENNKDIKYLLEPVNDPSFDGFANFHYLPNDISFIHLLGDFKKNPWVCDQLSKRLFLEYPSYYSRIESFFSEDIEFQTVDFSEIFNKNLRDVISRLKIRNVNNKVNEKYFRTLETLKRFNISFDVGMMDNKNDVLDLLNSSKKIIRRNDFSHLIDDIFSFEEERDKIVKSLLNSSSYLNDNFRSFQYTNLIFFHNDWKKKSFFKLTSLAFWIESNWDWAYNPFLINFKSVDKISINLKVESKYYVTLILFDYTNFDLMEYLLNPIETFLLSIASNEQWISTDVIFEQGKLFFEKLDNEIVERMLEDSIRFFAYSGVIKFK